MTAVMDPKAYVVIARKYRPQNFDEVIGQDHVSTTLKNAIAKNRIGHAYLFTGPRGVGKTSMARIFSKALNCKDGPTVNPCGKCVSCLEIEGTRALDVLEIDGASNRGIDEIRALRENVKFAPAAGKFKIYIIDEVHQITADGFNALLKTLEEPPAHVKFIFATTAAHKVPATILSRCQRFDFRRIPTAVIAAALGAICKTEKIKIDDDALFVIAKSADGSLRDGQSILDQLAASSAEKITTENIVQSLGMIEEERIFELFDALAARDARGALVVLDGAMKEGKDPALFLERVLEHTRDLLFLHVSEKLNDLLDASDAHKADLLKQKEKLSKEELFYFFGVFTHTLQILKRFEARRVPLEVALVKLAHRAPTENISVLLERLDRLGKSAPASPTVLSPRLGADLRKAKEKEDAEIPDIEELPSEDLSLPSSREKKSGNLDEAWPLLLRALKAEKISVASYLAEGEPCDFSNGVAKISFPERLNFHRESLEVAENKKLIERHLSSFLNQSVRIEFECVKELSGKNFAQGRPAEGLPPREEAPPAVLKSAMELFGGKIIRE
ncbi:MAG: DNA polymerase III subunit gamma/tau [Candidatus Omnitrophica bacterium]|nr:DNA polymerase III subunit gamma/tau [Candidatus Omnitrophota bacterium]